MKDLLVVLILLSFIATIIVAINPKWLSLNNRRRPFFLLLVSIVVFFILFLVISVM